MQNQLQDYLDDSAHRTMIRAF